MALLIPRRFELKAYDKYLTPMGVLVGRNSDAQSASFTVVHNGIGTGSVTLPLNHKLTEALMEDGARLQFRYIDHQGLVVLQLSGFVVADATELSVQTKSVTFTCTSDERLLARILGWPVPANTLSTQTTERDTRTGRVDQVCSEMVRDNLTRLGLPARTIPDVWSGQTTTIGSRFDPLLDVVRPALEVANQGIRVYQWNPGDPVPFFLTGLLSTPCLLVETYRCVDRPYVIWSSLLGINSGTVTTTGPSATRVVVGGDGEGTLRTFEGFVDTALEASWGPLGVQEVFVDARNTTDAAGRAQAAAEALDEARPHAAVDAETIDGDPWTVGVASGGHYNLGDVTRISTPRGLIPEKVRRITVSNDGQAGIRVKPQVGEPGAQTNTHEAVIRALSGQKRRTSRLEAGR